MLIQHQSAQPRVHPSAYVAPTAVVAGDVTIGERCRVLYGAVLVAEGGVIEIGTHAIVMEHAVVRATRRHPVRIGNHVLIGPHAYVVGCTVEDNVFIATGATIFNGAHIGTRSEVRINGVVHINTSLPADTTVPIGWVAVGQPAEVLPAEQHERIWSLQERLDFPGTVFGLRRAPAGQTVMPELTERYARALERHAQDQLLPG